MMPEKAYQIGRACARNPNILRIALRYSERIIFVTPYDYRLREVWPTWSSYASFSFYRFLFVTFTTFGQFTDGRLTYTAPKDV